MRHLLPKVLSATLLTALLSLLPAETHAQQDTLRIAYALSTLRTVQPQDAEKATNVFAGVVAHKRQMHIAVDTRVFGRLSDLAGEVATGRLHLISIMGQEYLELADSQLITPIFVPLRNNEVHERVVLLVRKEQVAAGLAGLAGKNLLVSVNLTSELSHLWLDAALLDAEQPTASEFFGGIREGVSPYNAALAVLNDRVDACVVVEAAFRALLANDPRLGEQLTVLSTSPPLIFSILCTSNRTDPELIEQVRAAIVELPQFPEGQQLLKTFGVNDHVPFRSEYLTGIHQLLDARKRRKAQEPVLAPSK